MGVYSKELKVEIEKSTMENFIGQGTMEEGVGGEVRMSEIKKKHSRTLFASIQITLLLLPLYLNES